MTLDSKPLGNGMVLVAYQYRIAYLSRVFFFFFLFSEEEKQQKFCN